MNGLSQMRTYVIIKMNQPFFWIKRDYKQICFDKEVAYDLISLFQSRMMFYLHACDVSISIFS